MARSRAPEVELVMPLDSAENFVQSLEQIKSLVIFR
jgi:hypothetical protein